MNDESNGPDAGGNQTGDLDQTQDSEKMDLIIDQIYAGQKIQAIKEYRDWRNADLKSAKEFIEKLDAELRMKAPEKFTSSNGGCTGLLLLGLVGSYYMAEGLLKLVV